MSIKWPRFFDGHARIISLRGSCRSLRSRGPWRSVAKGTRKPRAATVAFQSVPRTAATVLVSRPTSASASRDMAGRYAISVSAASMRAMI